MKAKAMQRLIEHHLLPSLTGFRVKGSLLYCERLDYLLRAFSFESSAFKWSDFHVQVFVVPLYVPTPHLYFNFGDRLGRGAVSWDLEREDESVVMQDVLRWIEREGLPFLANVREPADMIALIDRLDLPPEEPRVLETVAFSQVLAGPHEQAREKLGRLDILTMDVGSLPWEQAIGRQAAQLYAALERDPRQALDLLDRWRAETCANLRLTCPKLTI